MANTTTSARNDASATAGGYSRAEFTTWLTQSCQRQDIPVIITDAHVLGHVAVLLKTDARPR